MKSECETFFSINFSFCDRKLNITICINIACCRSITYCSSSVCCTNTARNLQLLIDQLICLISCNNLRFCIVYIIVSICAIYLLLINHDMICLTIVDYRAAFCYLLLDIVNLQHIFICIDCIGFFNYRILCSIYSDQLTALCTMNRTCDIRLIC